MVFYRSGREYNVLENAIYAATHRWIYVASHAFILCSASTSGIGEQKKNIQVLVNKINSAIIIIICLIIVRYATLCLSVTLD